MSTTVEVVYQSALLADAAYVSLHATDFVREGDIQLQAWDQDADNPSQIETFLDRGFSFDQFLKFREDYAVLHHQPDTLTGFSATLFENRHTGELHLAFRGSNELADYAQNIELAIDLAERIGSELQRGAVRDFLRAAGILDAAGAVEPGYLGRISLTGHSLGGHLALWTATQYPQLVARVDTFNGAGLEYSNPLSVLAETLLRDNLLGYGALDTSRVHNWYAERGIEVVASAVIAYRPGEHLPLFIEDHAFGAGSAIANHNMQSLVEALAAYRLFAAIDPTLDFAAIGELLEGSSNGGVGAIASATIALGDALGEAYAGIADPLALHALIAGDIAAGQWSGARIEVLAGRDDLAVAAAEDSAQGSAFRFALEHLHAFALVAPGAASAEVLLEAYSDGYLEHRAWLLQSLLLRNGADRVLIEEDGRGAEIFEDRAHGLLLLSEAAFSQVPAEQAEQRRWGTHAGESLEGGARPDALFGAAGDDTLHGAEAGDWLEGGEGADLLLGGLGADALYGGAGADQLEGGAGNDTLSGGAGADLYVFEFGEGLDRILDADSGGDRIVADLTDLASLRFEQAAPGSTHYRDAHGLGFELHPEPGGLLLRGTNTAAGALLISAWEQGDYGITLPGWQPLAPGQSPTPVTETTLLGDRVALDVDPGQEGVQYGYDALGNLLTDPLQVELRDDVLYGSGAGELFDSGGGADVIRGRAGDDHALAGAGEDWLEGEAGDDLLEGGSGRDRLYGGEGADRLEGGQDTDILAGGAGDDELHAGDAAEFGAVRDGTLPPATTRDWLAGGAGNDTLVGSSANEGLSGGGGADRIVAGSGDDHLLGDADIAASSFEWSWTDDTASERRIYSPASGVVEPPDGGADTLYGGAGADWIVAGVAADLAFGEAGDDQIGGEAGDDTLDGGEGNDLLQGDAPPTLLAAALHGNDQLLGGAGNDSLHGDGGTDRLAGGEGEDLLYGDSADLASADHGADTLDGGAGNDTLSGQGGNDLIDGGEGDDLVSADGGADAVDGGAGNDRLWGDSSGLVALDEGADLVRGGAGDDQIVGGGGDDTLEGGADHDSLWGAAGDDLLQGGAGDDELTAGDGNDRLAGNAGDDTLWGEAGNDSLHGGAGRDVLQGDAGEDWLYGESGADTLIGGQGNDWLAAGSGDDEVGGGAGNDTLGGGDGADLLYGDGEDDRLSGGEGADRLYGDADNDTLEGGAGDDLIDGGAGDDTFVLRAFDGNDTLVGGGGKTTLVFEGVAAPSGIRAEHVWGSQTVHLVLAGTRLAISTAEYKQLTELRSDAGAFAGSALVQPGDGTDQILLPGTADTLFAKGGTDTVYGGDGDDTLHGEGGHDHLRGEIGSDLLSGGDGMDTVYGGAGNDTLQGGASLDQLWGEDGADALDGGEGSDALWGGNDNDTLSGGSGADTLDGAAGNDNFVFQGGGGIDLLRARTPLAGELDTVLFGAGVAPAQLTLRSYGANNLHLELGTGDSLVVESFFADLARLPQLEFRFADDPATVWTAADVLQRMSAPTTEGADARDGFGGNDSIAGLGGADTLTGGGGNDTLEGGEGADRLEGGDGSDQLQGDTGADTLHGGPGADTYLYSAGDGDDVLIEMDGRVAGSAYTDVLRFGPGIGSAEVQIAPVLSRDFTGSLPVSGFSSVVATELRLTGGGSIRILEPSDTVNYFSRVDELHFADASQTVVTWSQLYAQLTQADDGHDYLEGSSAADTLDARGGDDLVYGGAGADWLQGGNGSDTLLGGSAGDTLDGGAGDDFLRGGDDGRPSEGLADVLVWGRGYGHDTAWTRPDNQFWIYASSGDPYPADELRLSGVNWSELRAVREGSDLSLYIPGTADRFTVLEYFVSGHQQVRINGGSGVFYLLADVERKIAETAILEQVTAGDDHVIGTEAFGENIDALAGNDLVEGLGGNDTLTGGEGNDTLDGGAGNDTLAGGLGNDSYRFGFGDGADRVLDQDKTTGRIDAVVMDASVRSDDIRIARVGDDLVLTLADSGEAITIAKHFVTKGKDVGFHIDAVRFAGGSEWNRAALLDYVNRSASGHYALNGGSAADALVGLGGNDTLQGFAGNDTLSAGAGNDRLLGGTGNDVLDGGRGADRYELLPGDGIDLLVDADLSAQVDVLAFGAGIDPVTTSSYRDGADLVLRYGSADAVRVRDFYLDGSAPGRGVEQIRFANGTVWQRAGLQAAGPLPANQPPVARDDAFNMLENGTHAVSTGMLLANDVDIDGDPLGLTAVRPGFGGAPALDAANGIVRFTPDLYYTGSAWFAYTLSDGVHNTEGRVDVQVTIDTGAGARLGTAGADTLAGTRGDDRLYGLGGNDALRADRGNDRLHGGSGNDTLEGAAGNDTYVFHRGDGAELIDNRSARSTDTDALYFTSGFARDELWFMREANDLVIGVVGSDDRVLVDEWFGADAARLDRIHVPGSLIYAAEVEQLVHAMAAFDAPIGAGTVMSSETRTALEPLLAAAWQPSGP